MLSQLDFSEMLDNSIDLCLYMLIFQPFIMKKDGSTKPSS